MSEVLLVVDEGPVRILTLNRPQARNALGLDLVAALYRALDDADSDDSVRVVILTGADPAFCAGVDLKQAATDGHEYFRRFTEQDCIKRVALMKTPIIGAVNGATFTGGLELAMGCDFLIASDRAVFADTHVRVGVMPGGGMTARLPQLVGEARARRMSMTGEVIDAARAEEIGLVTEVVPHALLMERAKQLAAAVADAPGPEMLTLKRIYTEGSDSIIGHALENELSIARAHPGDMEALEQRRLAVRERNRSQIDKG